MTELEPPQRKEGWRQIRAGVSLIAWSRLARFDGAALAFRATDEQEFEHSRKGHRGVHKEFGRLICWIGFSVGQSISRRGRAFSKAETSAKRYASFDLPRGTRI